MLAETVIVLENKLAASLIRTPHLVEEGETGLDVLHGN
jgi:hypothetical protein